MRHQNRMKRVVSLHALVLVPLLAVTRVVLGCSCMWLVEPGYPLLSNGAPLPTDLELVEQPFLFEGTLVTQVPIPRGLPEPVHGSPATSVATFRVEHVWRGTMFSSIIRVYTSYIGGGCGYAFEPNTCYLVFARVRDDGLLFTDICGRTAPYASAGQLLQYVNAYLGPPSTPDPK